MSARTIAVPGCFGRLGEAAGELRFRHVLLVADPGIPFVDSAIALLASSGVAASVFRDFGANPDSAAAARGSVMVREAGVDAVVALGGGSSLDCAKAVNLLATNGGEIADYRGYGKAAKPLLPMIAVPTTAGTGSEAQSYAVISDAVTREKMACGDPKASFAISILDPELIIGAPRAVRAASGFDAIAHAVETAATTRRSHLSLALSREAWRLLDGAYDSSLVSDTTPVFEAMQTGAYLAGLAIENSMLGAAHACSNPLTRHFDVLHGHALAIMLPHVVAYNGADAYRPLEAGNVEARLRWLASAGGLPATLREAGVGRESLPMLAEEAAAQWTGRFNPRPLDAAAALELYQCAF